MKVFQWDGNRKNLFSLPNVNYLYCHVYRFFYSQTNGHLAATVNTGRKPRQ